MGKVPTIVTVLFISLFVVSPVMGDFNRNKAGVQWMTPGETEAMMNRETRPVIIDVYTDWCHYCKVMDATTWRNDSVAAYIQQHFYPMKLNAEEKGNLTWQGKEYAYMSKYKVHKLAVELLRGNMVYPSTVIIPEKGEWEVLPGAFKPAEIEIVLKYYGSGANENMDFVQWQKQFKGTWR